jgi:hypothetical protein
VAVLSQPISASETLPDPKIVELASSLPPSETFKVLLQP